MYVLMISLALLSVLYMEVHASIPQLNTTNLRPGEIRGCQCKKGLV